MQRVSGAAMVIQCGQVNRYTATEINERRLDARSISLKCS